MLPSIVAHSGAVVRLENPSPNTLHLQDIAFALAHLNRYTGHVGGYSVAEHSLHVAALVAPEYRLEALLHDASEAYLGDMSSPLKLLCPDYRKVEDRFDAVLAHRFRLNQSSQCLESVKRADLLMLRAEATFFRMIDHPIFAWVKQVDPEVSVSGWTPRFLRREATARGLFFDAVRVEQSKRDLS